MKIEGLDSLHNLRELYLSHNGIEEIEGLENLVCLFIQLRCTHICLNDRKNKRQQKERMTLCFCNLFWGGDTQINLTTLDLAGNRIERLQNLRHLEHLEEFWVCYCSVLLCTKGSNTLEI